MEYKNQKSDINIVVAEALLSGIDYMLKGDYDLAIRDLTYALGINPNLPSIWLNRGNAYKAKGLYDDAISDFNRAVEIDSNYAEAYINRAFAYYHKREYHKALEDACKAQSLGIRPDPEFLEELRKALGERPVKEAIFKAAGDYFIRGNDYYRKGNYDQAISDFTRSIDIDPMFAIAYRHRGIVYYAKGLYDQAIQDYNQTLKINPSDADAYFNRGAAYYSKKEYDKALSDVQKALSLGFKVPSEISDIEKLLEELRRASGERPAKETNFEVAQDYVKRGNDNRAKEIDLDIGSKVRTAKLLRFLDSGRKGCWANIKMGNGDPCWIGIAQTGILVKKSTIGIFGAKLYEEKNIYKAAKTAQALSQLYPDDLTPETMLNPILKSITNAVLHCGSLAEVTRVLNEAYKSE